MAEISSVVLYPQCQSHNVVSVYYADEMLLILHLHNIYYTTETTNIDHQHTQSNTEWSQLSVN